MRVRHSHQRRTNAGRRSLLIGAGAVLAVLTGVLGIRAALTHPSARSESAPGLTHEVDGGATSLGEDQPAAARGLAAAMSPAGADRRLVGAVVEPDEPGELVRTRGTEREHYEAFLQLARRDIRSLEQLVDATLVGPGPDCRRVALLRALYDSGSSLTSAGFLGAMRVRAERGAGSEAIPTFAIRFLGERARADAAARAILEQAAFDEGSLTTPLRRWAAAEFCAAADAADLARLPALLWQATDPLLVEGAVAALTRNPHPAESARVLYALGRPIPARQAGTEIER